MSQKLNDHFFDSSQLLTSQLAMSTARKKAGQEAAPYIIDANWLPAQGGHRLFWMEWGNPQGKPFINLHGGPGTGFGPSHVSLFDPAIHHVIFYDQRGCGESTPAAATLNEQQATECANTDNLVADLELIRSMHFGPQRIGLQGSSWGSTHPLIFAERYPDKVSALVIGSIFLGTEGEIDEMFEHQHRLEFPYQNEYRQFIQVLANQNRALEQKLKQLSGRQLVDYLADKINHADPVIAKHHAVAFEVYEYVLCAPDGYSYPEGYQKLINEEENNPNIVSHARIEILSHKNRAFLKSNEILQQIGILQQIPIHIVNGKRDWCTPTKYAIQLKNAILAAGGRCTFEEVDSGHLRTDHQMKKALQNRLIDVARELPVD